MTTTKTIPAESLSSLGLHEGDFLRVVGSVGTMFIVEINRDEESRPAGDNSASTWLKSAKGSVKLAEGESLDDARMAYYKEKYHLNT